MTTDLGRRAFQDTFAALERQLAQPAYLVALGRVNGWRSDGAELVLVDADGTDVLRYELDNEAS